MNLLSYIREKAEVHRVWFGGTTEDERSYSDAKSKVLPEYSGKFLEIIDTSVLYVFECLPKGIIG